MILALSKTESDFIHKKNDVHFKELVNNINLAGDALDSYRELLSDQLNIYHMIISSKLNDIMKYDHFFCDFYTLNLYRRYLRYQL